MVGAADDGAGVQALVVEIGGTTRRLNGSAYHITGALGAGRKAVQSNDVVRKRGWRRRGGGSGPAALQDDSLLPPHPRHPTSVFHNHGTRLLLADVKGKCRAGGPTF